MANSGKIIAMWSGPRNLSTAMMRSFGRRADCTAVDEPFYAAYLKATGLNHPMRDEILSDGETDPLVVAEQCLNFPPEGKIAYQKHMTHHMIEAFPTDWIAQVTNVFLLRDPARVLASYANKTDQVTAEDIGFHKQYELMQKVQELNGQTPIVIDSNDIRANPKEALTALCAAIGIPFSDKMLNWKKGQHEEDGVWGRHWYDAIWNSTGFAGADTRPMPELDGKLAQIEAEVRPLYEAMSKYKIAR